MPMPSANLSRASVPSPWDGDDVQQLDGSALASPFRRVAKIEIE
ncbi:hypothetical protein GGQ64_005034 [Rhizobium azooxidifex]|uniref:Uncharacterized protein n=1 Tax=Mycoplana azooxidifex TaxID=1636188 RepID=A0A7W6GNA8_9HYPH|nr:hypothetical protein [Mycoplana azooxidifex]